MGRGADEPRMGHDLGPDRPGAAGGGQRVGGRARLADRRPPRGWNPPLALVDQIRVHAPVRSRGLGRGFTAPSARRGGDCLMEAGARARPAYRRQTAVGGWVYGVREAIGPWVALTKPRVISLLLVTTAATMFVADSSPPIGLVLATLLGGYLAAGGAGAI